MDRFHFSKANRSLPDIPKDKGDTHRNIESDATDIYAVPIIDGNQSELYATVQDQSKYKIKRNISRIIRKDGLTYYLSYSRTKFSKRRI